VAPPVLAPAPETPSALAMVPAGPAAAESNQALEDIAKKLDALFLEMGGLLSRPLQEVLTNSTSLSKSAMPPLTAASCKIADGRFEPIGNSLQKLLIWEQHLKEDTKVCKDRGPLLHCVVKSWKWARTERNAW